MRMQGGEGSNSNDAERSGKASCVFKITVGPGNVKPELFSHQARKIPDSGREIGKSAKSAFTGAAQVFIIGHSLSAEVAELADA
jgi:hypothetical protein